MLRSIVTEPLLSRVSFRWSAWMDGWRGHGHLDGLRGLHWVIVGGESGPGARPMRLEWVQEIRDRCTNRGIPFFFKQWGGVNKKAAGRVLDGRTWDELPPREVLGIEEPNERHVTHRLAG